MTLRNRTITLTGALVLVGALVPPTVSAHGSTCADFGPLGIEVHGQHVVRDYVTGGALAGWPPQPGEIGDAVAGRGAALPGGPGPTFHFENGFAPGASFCLSQSQAPGWHVGD